MDGARSHTHTPTIRKEDHKERKTTTGGKKIRLSLSLSLSTARRRRKDVNQEVVSYCVSVNCNQIEVAVGGAEIGIFLA
jgi:hypothetical protein